MTKRATRWKAEVFTAADDVVVWEVLVHDFPDPALRHALGAAGFKVRRANNAGKPTGPTPLTYSVLDPKTAVSAAIEHATRHETQKGNALLVLIANAGKWVSREVIRRVAGDSGDKRVRELRALNWPIEIKQLAPGEAWHVRLVLPDDDPKPGQGELPL